MMDVSDSGNLVQRKAQKGDNPEQPQIAAQPVVSTIQTLVILEIIDDLQQGDSRRESWDGTEELELKLRYRWSCGGRMVGHCLRHGLLARCL